MKEIIAYEMSFDGTPKPPADVLCVPFQKKKLECIYADI